MLTHRKAMLPACSAAMLGIMMAAVAAADITPNISHTIFTITATNDAGTGTLVFTQDDGLTYNPASDSYHWNTGTHVIYDDLFNPIATLQNATLAFLVNDKKKIAGSFAVAAGDTETTFVIEFAELTFPTVPGSLAEGRIGLAANTTDVGGGGTLMQALGDDGTGMLRGDYNGMVPDGTMFAQVLWRVVSTSGSASGYENYPASGYVDIPDDVSSMNSRVAFTLTPSDYGGGNHYFEIIPEPATLGLIAFGAAAFVLRRR